MKVLHKWSLMGGKAFVFLLIMIFGDHGMTVQFQFCSQPREDISDRRSDLTIVMQQLEHVS